MVVLPVGQIRISQMKSRTLAKQVHQRFLEEQHKLKHLLEIILFKKQLLVSLMLLLIYTSISVFLIYGNHYVKYYTLYKL